MPNRCAALLVLILLAALPSSAAAAPADNGTVASVWDGVDNQLANRSASGAPVAVRPDAFAAFTLDRALLRSRLAGTPDEDERGTRLVTIPGPDGALERFRAVESPVLAPALGRRFPAIRTYAATGVDDPTATARFDLTPLGFHASVSSERGAWYVDPYYRNEARVHVAYFRADRGTAASPLTEPEEAARLLARDVARADVRRAPGDAVVQRTYRLAIANDHGYADFFGNTDLLVESAKASLMNRVNQLYNDDLAIRMEIVPDNHLLNFETEPQYTAAGYTSQDCSGTTLNQNQTVIDRVIGAANYDIGHLVVSVVGGGGGIAGLGVVGRNGQKARGCTGLVPPVGDGFAIDYVAHEMGHQFGGPHTFDGVNGACGGGNRDLTGEAAVEPGSGTSIQAYAGICDDADTGQDDNLQPNSDPYFSQQSVDDILGYVTSGIANANEEGFEVVTTANRSPVVDAGADRTIPVRTPFTLSGSATDADGDGLVYLWEQNDSGGPDAGTPLQADGKLDGPLFRVFSKRVVEDPTLSPAPGQNIAREVDKVRSFPDAAQVAAGNTNQQTGVCALVDVPLDCYSEYLPTAEYALASTDLNFRLTARDRVFTGGGLSFDDVTLALSPVSGPFVVLEPGAGPLVGGSEVTVEWDPAGTAVAPVSTPNVKISYSTDGGLTFNYVALASTANDGEEPVTVPNVATTTGRFKVEAIDNYFYDVSDADLTVTADAAAATPTATASPTAEPTAAPTVVPLTPAVPGATATATASATADPEATPTPTPTPTVTATPTATPPYDVPTPTPTATPETGTLRPDVSQTAKRLRVTKNRRVRVRIRCAATGSPAGRCRGSVALFAKIDGGRQRRIARTAIRIRPETSRKVTLRLNARAFRVLNRRGRLKAKLRARSNGRSSAKRVTLRR